jgi:murein DD-endopeptidase MepM/ murein hydrolase activator NlpD
MKSRTLILIWLISLVLLSGIFIFKDQIKTELIPALSELTDKNRSDESADGQDQPDSIQEDSPSAFKENFENQPLSYTLPTPGTPPVSYWRPPLYEAPWALTPFDHFYFTRPIAADEVNWPLADYRYGYFFPGTDIVHTGIDIGAPLGTPVYASASGKVVWAGYGLYYGNDDPDDPYGKAVTIAHDFSYNGDRLLTVYAHMDRVDVAVGQEVEAGTQLGIVGLTGFTTGPHLHFEVRLASNSFFRTRNPELWLTPPQGWGVLVGQLRKSDYNLINYQEVYVRNKETNQTWMVRTYGPSSVNKDDFYQENLVLSDLPAGDYLLYFDYLDINYKHEVSIYPGAVSYFTFRENIGFKDNVPTLETPDAWDNMILTDDFLNNNPIKP